jgi:hypothetical protein
MTNKPVYLNLDFSTDETKHTLKSLNQPKELFDELYKRKFGMGIISGTNLIEIRKTLTALSHAWEGYRGSIEIRSAGSEPLPGVASLNMDAQPEGAAQVLRSVSHGNLIFFDAVVTPEKLVMATRFASVGGMVFAPVISPSVEATVNMLSELGKDIAPYSFANSFTYIAQQTVISDPFADDEHIVVTEMVKVTEDMRNELVMARYRPSDESSKVADS